MAQKIAADHNHAAGSHSLEILGTCPPAAD